MDIRSYLSELQKQLSTGVAKEHAYRPALKELFESTNLVTAINDPARSEYGNPDFIFQDKQNSNLLRGYGESKDIAINLDIVEKSEQMSRYLGYSNLVLTNGLDFRFFRNGEKYFQVNLGHLDANKIITEEENISIFSEELKNFLQKPPEKIRSAKRLSEIMGGKARRIRENITIFLKRENDERNIEIEKIYKVITESLVHDLTIEKFSDMYAQTLVYGLFIARYSDNSLDTFTRSEARDLVPASNPFLRQFFDHIAGNSFDKRLAYIVDELCAVFEVSDIKTIIKQHFKQDSLLGVEVQVKDPIIHFYEDFLKEYDAELKKKMGAYYTPVPVVKYIVRAVDDILKTEFGLSKGLADTSTITKIVKKHGSKIKETLHRVQILDPAVGTATFLNELVKYIFENNFKGQEGRWTKYVDDDLIPRLYGFELMMAPYTIAHLKLGMTLKELGYNKEFEKRLGIYLTNTLEEGVKRQLDLLTFGLQEAISKESQAAAEIKHNKPIMVIIGNPPYSGVSSNETEYANSLIQKYKVEPGGKQKLQERKHWLNDDYVKFIAFAEDLIEKNNEGVVAMITNNGYLDNPTFRGMRWHLAKTFNKIYVLNLHGNSKKKETSVEGGKDENVFDIMQGVSIILAVKNGNKKKDSMGNIYHADLFGTRKHKFNELSKNTDWQKIVIDPKTVFFVPKNNNGQDDYEKGIALNELFSKSVAGIVTARDNVVIDIEKNILVERIEHFSNVNYSDEEIRSWLFPNKASDKYEVGDSRGWKLTQARQKVRAQNIVDSIKDIEYRPFDTRSIYYVPEMVDWGRFPMMSNMMNVENTGICFGRNIEQKRSWADVFVTNKIITHHSLSIKEVNYFAPLYIYHPDGARMANFDAVIIKNFTKNLKNSYVPENILDYTYAVLYSVRYREKYQEFLKIDFPRVPYPKDETTFWQLVKQGNKLRELHLMTDPELEKPITTYSVSGNDTVEKIEHKDEKVFINNEQYFGNVSEVAWNFYIGGYQPAQKWLKDRKNRTLSNEDIEHYQKIIKVLIETDKVMKEIDQIKFM